MAVGLRNPREVGVGAISPWFRLTAAAPTCWPRVQHGQGGGWSQSCSPKPPKLGRQKKGILPLPSFLPPGARTAFVLIVALQTGPCGQLLEVCFPSPRPSAGFLHFPPTSPDNPPHPCTSGGSMFSFPAKKLFLCTIWEVGQIWVVHPAEGLQKGRSCQPNCLPQDGWVQKQSWQFQPTTKLLLLTWGRGASVSGVTGLWCQKEKWECRELYFCFNYQLTSASRCRVFCCSHNSEGRGHSGL